MGEKQQTNLARINKTSIRAKITFLQFLHPVCKLCRDHEKAGFVEGVKVGIRLRQEIGEK